MNFSFNETSLTEAENKLLSNTNIVFVNTIKNNSTPGIKVNYVGYSRGSKRVVKELPLKKNLTSATLSYRVMFSEDFQWVLGGKLHGLGPKSPITGGQKRNPSGWSVRVTFEPNGKCALYIYDQSQQRKYGTTTRSQDSVFTKGKWHEVILQLMLNDLGASNGWAKVFVDGKLSVHREGILFRKNDLTRSNINKFLFSTFHGGHNLKWSPKNPEGEPTTVTAFFDDFNVYAGIVDANRLSRTLH